LKEKIFGAINLRVEKRFGPKSVPNVPSKEEPIDVWRRSMKQLEQRNVREMFGNVPHSFFKCQTASSIENIRLDNKMNQDEDLTRLICDYFQLQLS